MPVTIRPSPDKIGRNTRATILPSDFLKLQLNRSERGQAWRIGKPRPILHTSFSSPLDDGTPIIPYGNGFIHGAISAFAQDLHLVISPDDVWLAIITQFSFYVNAHAEDLREFFVHHEGKKELVIKDAAASPETLDVDWLALEMAKLIQNELVDPEIKDWLVPNFSTTTNNDRAVASMVLMGTLQKYFDYGCRTKCGLPSVTLLGEREDWEDILARLDRFGDFGDQPKSWVKLLTPILTRFVSTFNDPDDEQLKNFWLQICHSEAGRGSGQTSVFTGWITGFTYWKSDGTRLIESKWNERDHTVTTLDGQDYPIIGQSKVPAGVITVPLFIDDLQSRIRINTTIVAGSVGMTLTEEDTKVRPRSGWWMLEDERVPLKF